MSAKNSKAYDRSQVTFIPRPGTSFGPDTMEEGFAKAFLEEIPAASRQDCMLGRKEHPFSYSQAHEFRHVNVHHSACIEAKVAATVGLGFTSQPTGEKDPMTGGPASDPATGKPKLKKSAVSLILDPLCEVSFQHLLTEVCEDYWTCGVGFVEVVEDESDEVLALYHCPARDVYKVLEDQAGNYHYEVTPSDGMGFTRVFARFGDRKRLLRAGRSGTRRLGGSVPIPNLAVDGTPRRGRPRKSEPYQSKLTSLICIPRPSAQSRHYGMPDWLSAVLTIELVHCKHRHLYDFFLNRGVPEMILTVSGLIEDEDWDQIQEKLKGTVGLGNQHKSMAIRFNDTEAKAQVHKLAMERMTDGLFNELADVLAMQVVSAHGVPPLLAGIQIPGKLGATNELVNAMQAFQVLRIAPAQQVFEIMLSKTLGSRFPEIKEEDWKLRTILEEINVDKADTISRMRQPLAEANAQGRDLESGVKD